MLIATGNLSSQTNYQDLLVRTKRSYWANPYTVSNSGNFDIYFSKQSGIYFDITGLFDRYLITDDNDTIPGWYNLDTEMTISHRTYKLENDTIFLTAWFKETGNSRIIEAYKILYLKEQRLLLMELKSDGKGGWEESIWPDGYGLILNQYIYMEPQ